MTDYSLMGDNVTSLEVVFANLTTTTSRAPRPECHPAACEEGPGFLRLVTEFYLSIPIVLIGIIGNILAFIVLCSQKRKISTTVILMALAVVDTLILLFAIPLKILYYASFCLCWPTNYKEPWKVMFRYMLPSLFILRMIDTWLIVFLSVDRWIAVSRPLHAPRLCTLKRTFIEMVLLVIFAVVFGAPRWFESTQYGFFDHNSDVTVLEKYDVYIYVYALSLFFIFMYLVPMTLMIVLNVQLILSLRKASRSMAGRRHSQSAQTSQHRSVTVIVVSVVVTCVVCNVFSMLSHVLKGLMKVDDAHKESIGEVQTYVTQTGNVLVLVNSSINFFLYCFSSKNFRQSTLRAFRLDVLFARIGHYSLARTEATDVRSDIDMTTTTHTNGHVRENDIQMKELLK